MTTIYFEGQKLLLPSQLSEFSPRQLRRVLHIQRQETDPAGALWALLLAILSGRQRLWLAVWLWLNYTLKPLLGRFRFINVRVKQISDEQLTELLDLIQGLQLDSRPLINPPHRYLWVWLWGFIPFPLKAPGQLLTTTTFRQFRRTEKALAGCSLAAGHAGIYWGAVLELYGYPAALRKPVAAAVQCIDESVLDAIGLFYTGSRRALIGEHPYLFPKSNQPPPAPGEHKLPTARQIEADWSAIRRAIAGNLKDEERTDQTTLWDFIAWANWEAKAANDRKQPAP